MHFPVIFELFADHEILFTHITMFCCCGVHCESRFSENDLYFNSPFMMTQLSELLFLHQYLIFSIGLNSALFSIVQHYSSLFRIIHHCSALFSIVQHCSRELKTSCRQPIPQCLKSILDRRRQRVFNSRSCRWVPSTLLSTSIYNFYNSPLPHFLLPKTIVLCCNRMSPHLKFYNFSW